MSKKNLVLKEAVETPSANVSSLPYIIGVLTDPYRLQLVGHLATQAYSLEELSVLLHKKISFTARRLKKLQELGIVKRWIEDQTYSLDMEMLQHFQRSLFNVENKISPLEETALDDEERRILKSFFVRSRLATIPAGRENLAILVRWFARRFPLNVYYQEAEVNQIIEQYYHDAAFFRKDMVGRGFMQRKNGVYWRVK